MTFVVRARSTYHVENRETGEEFNGDTEFPGGDFISREEAHALARKGIKEGGASR